MISICKATYHSHTVTHIPPYYTMSDPIFVDNICIPVRTYTSYTLPLPLNVQEGSVRTDVRDATIFYPAQDDHQAYLEKNPYGYCNHAYRFTEWPN